MAIRNLRYEGDEILSKRAREIEVIDDKIKEGFKRENMETANLSYVFSRNARNDGYVPAGGQQVTDSRLYKIAKAFIGAIQ